MASSLVKTRPPSMPQQALEGAGLVVDREPVDDRLTRRVQPDDLDVGTLPAELEHDRIEGRPAGDVPDIRALEDDCDVGVRLLEVECGGEVVGRGEEYLVFDPLCAGDYGPLLRRRDTSNAHGLHGTTVD